MRNSEETRKSAIMGNSDIRENVKIVLLFPNEFNFLHLSQKWKIFSPESSEGFLPHIKIPAWSIGTSLSFLGSPNFSQ